jgi:hypothetical protein
MVMISSEAQAARPLHAAPSVNAQEVRHPPEIVRASGTTTWCLTVNTAQCIEVGNKIDAGTIGVWVGDVLTVIVIWIMTRGKKGGGKHEKFQDDGEEKGGKRGLGLCLNNSPLLSSHHGVEIGKCGGENSEWVLKGIETPTLSGIALESYYWYQHGKKEFLTASKINSKGFVYLNPRLVAKKYNYQAWYPAGLSGG